MVTSLPTLLMRVKAEAIHVKTEAAPTAAKAWEESLPSQSMSVKL